MIATTIMQKKLHTEEQSHIHTHNQMHNKQQQWCILKAVDSLLKGAYMASMQASSIGNLNVIPLDLVKLIWGSARLTIPVTLYLFENEHTAFIRIRVKGFHFPMMENKCQLNHAQKHIDFKINHIRNCCFCNFSNETNQHTTISNQKL